MRKIYKLYIGIMLSAIAAGLWRMFLLTRNLRKNG